MNIFYYQNKLKNEKDEIEKERDYLREFLDSVSFILEIDNDDIKNVFFIIIIYIERHGEIYHENSFFFWIIKLSFFKYTCILFCIIHIFYKIFTN